MPSIALVFIMSIKTSQASSEKSAFEHAQNANIQVILHMRRLKSHPENRVGIDIYIMCVE